MMSSFNARLYPAFTEPAGILALTGPGSRHPLRDLYVEQGGLDPCFSSHPLHSVAAEALQAASFFPITTARSAEMDLAFIALTIALALLTLGLGRLCAKLLGGRQ
jgi:hypothetical protein